MSNPKVVTVAFVVAEAFIVVVLLLPSAKQEVTASMPAGASTVGIKSK